MLQRGQEPDEKKQEEVANTRVGGRIGEKRREVVQLTLKLRVTSDRETEKILKETIKAYTGSFNRVSAKGWQEERINGVELHKRKGKRL